MQASLYRRNYHLIRANEENQATNRDKNESIIYQETAKIINEMIGNLRMLLIKANSFREQLKTVQQIEQYDQKLESFKKIEKSIPLTFFSNYPLDSKMSGPFVMRINREMNYWKTHLAFLSNIQEDIDQNFQEQRKMHEPSISLLYFICIKKIVHQIVNEAKQVKSQLIAAKRQIIEQQPNIFLVPSFSNSLHGDSLQKQKNHMQQMMKNALSKQYRNMDVQSLEAINKFVVELSYKDNADLIYRKQVIRNKKMRKQIKEYKHTHQEYVQKKIALQHRRDSIKLRKSSGPNNSTSLKIRKSFKGLDSFNQKQTSKNIFPKLSFPNLIPSKFQERTKKSSSLQSKIKNAGKQNKVILKQSGFKIKKGFRKQKTGSNKRLKL